MPGMRWEGFIIILGHRQHKMYLGKPNCVFRKNVIKLNAILVLVVVVVGVGVLVLQSFLDFVCGNQNVCSLDAVAKTMPLAE